MRNAVYANLALCCLLAACGKEPAAPQAAPAAPQEKPAAPEPAPAPGKPDAPKPGAALTPAPSERVTKDANGQDWASHMGDIAFTFDARAAATRAEQEKRALMMFFTSPT